jgi:hypothetical protein
VIVLETVGAVADFLSAVRRIPDMEWLGEIDEEDIPADDDFFALDASGHAKPDTLLRGRLYLVFSNQRAMAELLSLWNRWKSGEAMPHGHGKWKELFGHLRDVRPWSTRDRLLETGVLEDWRERLQHDRASAPCEIELWYRGEPAARAAAQERVANLVRSRNGRVIREAVVHEIAYHAMAVELPAAAIAEILGAGGADLALVQCEQIQFFRASGQMAATGPEGERTPDVFAGAVPPPPPEEQPVVALLDGLPLQSHDRLTGRLIVDDPDNLEDTYQAAERRHGTAMASLILHGDLDAQEPALRRPLYVRPILRPDTRDWRSPRDETIPEDTLVVDLIHRAVRRLFEREGDLPPVAPSVCVINLSIGIRDRLFAGPLSPLARLLDWLEWEHKVLFVVSAGNHAHAIELPIPSDALPGLAPEDLQRSVLQAVAADSRHRRLLSPAEAVNVLTVGATHADAGGIQRWPGRVNPYLVDGLPSPINAQGMGYRRAIKPDILAPGGRVLLQVPLQTTQTANLAIAFGSRPPGQRVAAPGTAPGATDASWYSRGTSNAAALTSRRAAVLVDVLEELEEEPDSDLIEAVPRAVWLKALLVHAAQWGAQGEILEQVLKTPQNSRKFKEYVTRLLGYGTIDVDRVSACTPFRVTALSGGALAAEQAHVHRYPLPPSLSGWRGWRRLTITLAWLSPVNPAHGDWRRAHVWFTPPKEPVDLLRQQADHHAVQRGTVQHEVLEGKRAAAFVDGDNLDIQVSCRPDAGALDETVPYALAVTLEVAEEIGVPIYDEVRVRVQAARVRVEAT